MWNQDCGTVGRHGVGLREEVREEGAVCMEPGTDLLLEGTQIDFSLAIRLHGNSGLDRI
jgi:hypothetical protein